MCEECELGFHYDCVNPPLQEIPEEGYWVCDECKSGQNGGEEDLEGHSRKKRKV